MSHSFDTDSNVANINIDGSDAVFCPKCAQPIPLDSVTSDKTLSCEACDYSSELYGLYIKLGKDIERVKEKLGIERFRKKMQETSEQEREAMDDFSEDNFELDDWLY